LVFLSQWVSYLVGFIMGFKQGHPPRLGEVLLSTSLPFILVDFPHPHLERARAPGRLRVFFLSPSFFLGETPLFLFITLRSNTLSLVFFLFLLFFVFPHLAGGSPGFPSFWCTIGWTYFPLYPLKVSHFFKERDS